MGPPSYMRSIVHRNIVMRRMTVFQNVIGFDPTQVIGFWCPSGDSLGLEVRRQEDSKNYRAY